MFRPLSLAGLAIAAQVVLAAGVPAQASDNPALDADIHRLERQWAHIKYEVDQSRQLDQLAILEKDAEGVAAHYPDKAEALIWHGIVLSEEASLASMFSALGYAKQARDLLEKAERIDPTALEAGAPTSLGVLYYRVPGFPIAFGDKDKARRLLEEAVTRAPDGMDANYFYADYLVAEHEYDKAHKVLEHALTLPPRPDRPVWDHYRRIVIKQLIDQIDAGDQNAKVGTRS
jgi:tetratricopeptide (TPR) repeat protein